MEKDIKKPDYDNSLLSVTTSLLKYYGISSPHASLPELDNILAAKAYKNIVFMVLDGFGSYVMDTHLAKEDFLQRHKIRDISSVYPCTTTAATTTMHSGLSPLEHGWIAWACDFKETDECLELFSGKTFHTKKAPAHPVVPAKILSYETILQKIKNNPKHEIIDTNEVFPAFKPDGAKTISEFCEKITAICHKPNKQFIYAYWDNPDKTMHEKGVKDSPEAAKVISEINDALEQCTRQNPGTLFVITADHGHMDIKENIFLNEIPEIMECLSSLPSMERRIISFKVKDGMKDIFQSRFNARFGNDFLLLEKEKYIKEFLGKGTPHPRIEEFVGDFVAMGITDKALYYKHPDAEQALRVHKGHHAGLTSIEMTVPLIVKEGGE